MAKQQVVNIALSKIENVFDVRTTLDEDRVKQFALQYQTEDPPPPILVVQLDEEGEKFAYVDGRHRGAGCAYLGFTDIPAIIDNTGLKDDPLALYAKALQSNWGGAKPPSQQDIAHTFIRLIEEGVTQKDIRTRFNSFIPRGSLEFYIQWAKGVLHKRRITQAKTAISEGMNVEEAAATYRLKTETVKDAVAGNKRHWGKDAPSENYVVTDHKVYIGKALKSANLGIAKKIDILMRETDAGGLSADALIQVIEFYQKHVKRTLINIEDKLARAKALEKGISALPSAEEEEAEEVVPVRITRTAARGGR
jgi:ParB-like nuclease domain